MKFSLFVTTCVAFTLAVGGCAELSSRQPARTVSQKTPPSQTTTAMPRGTYDSGPGAVSGDSEQISVAPARPVAQAPAPQPVSGKVKAAILLPLSGKNAALGQEMLNAAQQAVFDAAGDNFELQPRDTAGEGGAEEAARGAVAGGVRLIIGPLFAADVPAVKLVAQSSGLQMLPLSTDTSLAERGVYVMGLAPGAQVERVVSYAVKRGARRFAALVPATPYGDLAGKVFQSTVAARGGELVALETLDRDPAEKIRGLSLRRDSIDAVFLPLSGAELKTVAEQMAAAGFDPRTHILGTGLWDVPGVGKLNPLLSGAWFAAPDPAQRRSFAANYEAVYGHEPQRLSTLAYDATALAAVLAKHGGRYDEGALLNPNGFAGLDGIFRLTATGTVERALAVLEVTPEGARVVDASPSSFVGFKR